MEVKNVQTLGWQRPGAAISVLLAMEEQRTGIGTRVTRLREARNLSQEALAQLAGVSVKTISRLETGRHQGRFDTIDRVADALRVPSLELLGGDETPSPLGLGSTQLDRIEATLAELSQRMDRIEDAVGLHASPSALPPRPPGGDEPLPLPDAVRLDIEAGRRTRRARRRSG